MTLRPAIDPTPPRREIINPSDEITIDYVDPVASDVAVLRLGMGMYGIEGDDGLPLFVGASRADIDAWCRRKHRVPIEELLGSVSGERIAAALESVRCDGARTSANDIAGRAAKLAGVVRKQAATAGGAA